MAMDRIWYAETPGAFWSCLISIGIAGFIAVRAISYGLHEVRRLNEIPEEPSPASGLSAETEDGTVSLSTNLHEIRNLPFLAPIVWLVC